MKYKPTDKEMQEILAKLISGKCIVAEWYIQGELVRKKYILRNGKVYFYHPYFQRWQISFNIDKTGFVSLLTTGSTTTHRGSNIILAGVKFYDDIGE